MMKKKSPLRPARHREQNKRCVSALYVLLPLHDVNLPLSCAWRTMNAVTDVVASCGWPWCPAVSLMVDRCALAVESALDGSLDRRWKQ